MASTPRPSPNGGSGRPPQIARRDREHRIPQCSRFRKRRSSSPSGKHTLLPLDDCLYALQATIPHLTRSSLHRCLQRHGISRLPEVTGDKPAKKKFKAYPIGYFHIDIAEVHTEEGRLSLFVAIDRTSKFAFAQLHEKATRRVASDFLRTLISAVPDKIHTVLTDNGIQFRLPPRYADGPIAPYCTHMFDMRCRENGIEHRFTKINHPWTNGQVERMNRTIEDATVKRYHYDSHDQLRQHLNDFVSAYNFGRRLKGLTPYESICKIWTAEPNASGSIRSTKCRDFSIRRVEVKRLPSCPTPQCSMFFARPCFSSGSALTPSQYGIRRMKRAI
jgi:transposase InsO family protein